MIISEKNRVAIQERFAELEHPVVLQFYESSLDCPTCPEIRQLLTELVELSNQLTLETYDLYADSDRAQAVGIDKAPAICLTDDSRKDYGIRFYGAPSGYEFATLLEDIRMISRHDSGLQPDTIEQLVNLTQAVDLSVFVTPT